MRRHVARIPKFPLVRLRRKTFFLISAHLSGSGGFSTWLRVGAFFEASLRRLAVFVTNPQNDQDPVPGWLMDTPNKGALVFFGFADIKGSLPHFGLFWSPSNRLWTETTGPWWARMMEP